MGYLKYLLGIEVTQKPKYIFISQQNYIVELLDKFGMTDCKTLSTPMEQNLKPTSKEVTQFEDATKNGQLVGSLIYILTARLEIAFVVEVLSRYM